MNADLPYNEAQIMIGKNPFQEPDMKDENEPDQSVINEAVYLAGNDPNASEYVCHLVLAYANQKNEIEYLREREKALKEEYDSLQVDRGTWMFKAKEFEKSLAEAKEFLNASDKVNGVQANHLSDALEELHISKSKLEIAVKALERLAQDDGPGNHDEDAARICSKALSEIEGK